MLEQSKLDFFNNGVTNTCLNYVGKVEVYKEKITLETIMRQKGIRNFFNKTSG